MQRFAHVKERETVTLALPAYRALDSSEAPPSYRCTINLQGRLLRKKEFHKPATAAARSRWEYVEGKLSLSRARAYTLQLADAGLAVDSKDRVRAFSKDGGNAFRLRVEGEQLLYVAPTAETASIWVEQILAAAAISGPLDERAMNEYPCTPPRRPKASNTRDQGISGRWHWTKSSGQVRRQLEWLTAVSDGIQGEQLNQKVEIEKEPMASHRAEAQTKVMERSIADAIMSNPDSGLQRSDRRLSGAQCPCSIGHTPDSFNSTQPRYLHENSPATSDLHREPVRSALDDPRRWIRILTFSSAWRHECYIKDGRKVHIARSASLNVPLY
ncbi:hypothetical protein BDY17DRAFT_314239 [Neohortaea acidophila]|uniref:PH domain-containing protein n=1 Tax=Neohortaea acidophila TaxID=245834 RepID=A0A6A6PFK3_9PEZI|nr:uncharacterized protein BDY17DRAFT_314239 [Neohortaea acidophila]KAF2478433.1 hypothetical protein BDY17DRAFT_314239 [Neohortaea acidophila]